jgi:CHAD domain-containing protein
MEEIAERAEQEEARSAPFIARKARALDDALAAALPRVLGNTDTEAVHDLRVALRRLRTLLKLARPVLGRFHADAVRAGFVALQTATGDLRDEEALVETLDALAMAHEPLRAWRQRRLVRERRLRRSLIQHLQRGELDTARALLHALLLLPVRPDRDVPLGKLARRLVKSAREEVLAGLGATPDDVVGLHNLRIAYKKLRYAIEIFEEALPPDLVAMGATATRFQKRLGDLHDLDVAKVSIHRARGMGPVMQRRVLLALDGARAKKLAKYLAELVPEEALEAPKQ